MAHRVQSLIESIHADGSCPRLQVDLTCDGIVCPDFVCEKWGEELVIDLDPSYPLDLEFTATGVDVDLSFGGYVTRCTFPYAAIYMVADRATGRGILIDENMPESVRRRRQPSRAPDVEAEKRAAMEKLAREARSKRGPGSSRRRKRRRPGDEATETSVEQVEAAASDAPPPEAPPKIGLAVVRPAEPEAEPEPEPEPETAPAAIESPTPIESAAEPEPAPQPQPVSGSEARNLDSVDPPADDPPRPSDQEALRRRSVFKVIDGGK